MLPSDEPDDQVRQLEGSAGLLQHGADEGTQDDDDANGGKGPGETGADHARHLPKRNARQQRQHQCDGHDGQKRMHLEFRNQQDHGDDRHDKRYYR